MWEALLEEMPMTALIRNLGVMTRVGLLGAGVGGDLPVARLRDG
ncbi:MAG: TROVE domain-containing protein [Dehalococcoidia bacterium]